MSSSFPLSPRILIFLLSFLAAGMACAQFETGLQVNKDNYLVQEGVIATVTVTNRSGSDVVMGGPNGTAWLSFEITDPRGRTLPPMNFRSEEQIVFKSGTTITKKVQLGENFSFSDPGPYGIVANVYHPPTQQYYASNRMKANFMDVVPFMKKIYGVPMGLPDAGKVRRYDMCLLRNLDHMELYVKIMDDKTNLTLTTLGLGHCIMVSDPQVGVDPENRLHVLYMMAPHIYAHVGIDTQGMVFRRLYYREVESNRPALTVQSDRSIGVTGGVPYDPVASNGSGETPRPPGRSVKDKPPGF
jgi:hypothetical protein